MRGRVDRDTPQVATPHKLHLQHSGSACDVCPVCGGQSVLTGGIAGWGDWRSCEDCTLMFASPIWNGTNQAELFNNAYLGAESVAGMRDFAERLDERDGVLKDPTLWFWTPAYGRAIRWLGEVAGRDGTVLDLGCGPGYVLRALKNLGFTPVGLDVAERAVVVNRRDGFKVWHGTVDDYPDDWPRPDAVVSFFVLHHFDQPLETIRRVRRKWPDARLAIATYGPTNYDPVRTTPPRTLTRWNEKSLRALLTRAGYFAEVVNFPSTGTEDWHLRPVGGIRRRIQLSAAGVRMSKRMENRILPLLVRPLRKPDFVVLGLATSNPRMSMP